MNHPMILSTAESYSMLADMDVPMRAYDNSTVDITSNSIVIAIVIAVGGLIMLITTCESGNGQFRLICTLFSGRGNLLLPTLLPCRTRGIRRSHDRAPFDPAT
ncbi:hypothetical protein L596_004482 [Steinernema carpocapsae]|uniref:Uncharacterized protein n=1 Tax=Steinernema carpocapsae TaxID=34508 RepID=A0A4U8UW40_STECR|nr:hypothetical protein L596_004482 [Steinernema carpocapsae]